MIPSLFTLKVQYIILAFVGVPVSYLFNLHWKNEEPYRKTSVNTEETFDFIIVGGGTAGLVVANRLSEHYNVLLLEAGGHPFPLTAVPGLAGSLLRHPDIDWADKAVPQEHACHAFKDNGSVLNHGRGLGGSSMINYMMYMRGSPEDYNEWARVTKDSDWSYKKLLPFFKKMESYQGQFTNEKNHGNGGNVHIESAKFGLLTSEWEQAAKELGYKIMDPNGFQEEGFFPIESNNKNGSRDSTYTAYIEPILNRQKLKIELYAHATKVELDKKNRAVGVHYIKNGVKYFAKASKEIILSAGALGSPKILMLSGIGPAEHLKSLGIPVKLDLPVGKSLQDHVITQVGPFILEPGTGFVAHRDMKTSVFSEYLEYNRGPLSVFGCAGGAVIESSLAEKGWPDVLLVGGAGGGLYDDVVNDLERTMDFRRDILEEYYKGHIGNDTFTIAVALGRPTGRGELKLASTDPFEPPIIDPKYLQNPHDRQVLLEGAKFARKIVETGAFKAVGARLIPNLLPGCEQYGSADNDDYWKCYLKQWTFTMWHFSCTCRMGAKNDQNSVVDSKLRVRGAKGLRVIDNSIMPQVTNANTNIPAILIGEKGADIVLRKWKPKKGQKS